MVHAAGVGFPERPGHLRKLRSSCRDGHSLRILFKMRINQLRKTDPLRITKIRKLMEHKRKV